MTVWMAAEGVNEKQKALARATLRACGEEAEVKDETYIDSALWQVVGLGARLGVVRAEEFVRWR